MSLEFEKQANKGKEFLKDLTHELGLVDNEEKAGRIFKSVLFTLRDHMPNEASMELMTRLPVYLRGVYSDGWKMKKSHADPEKIVSLNEFVFEVMKKNTTNDFIDENRAVEHIKDIFRTLERHMSEEDKLEIESILPSGVDQLWDEIRKGA